MTQIRDYKGSQSERLHDLGMVAGLVASAAESLATACSIAKTQNLLPEETLRELEALEDLWHKLNIGPLSVARVVELHEKAKP